MGIEGGNSTLVIKPIATKKATKQLTVFCTVHLKASVVYLRETIVIYKATTKLNEQCTVQSKAIEVHLKRYSAILTKSALFMKMTKI